MDFKTSSGSEKTDRSQGTGMMNCGKQAFVTYLNLFDYKYCAKGNFP